MRNIPSNSIGNTFLPDRSRGVDSPKRSRKSKARKRRIARIALAERDLNDLFQLHGTESAAIIAKRTGLPYLLVYNVVRKRVVSVSKRHYQILFSKHAPNQVPLKVDGDIFRAMVDLWLFLNDGLTRADLYRELYGSSSHAKVDHRIFSGKINAVDTRVEHIMRGKFLDSGVDEPLLRQWIDEFEALSHSDRVPYARVRPVLQYLEDNLGIHPTSVLKQSVARYEAGILKSVPRSIADRAGWLKRKTEKALRECRENDLDKIKETIVGGKPGYTLYSDIKDELLFLCRYSKNGIKKYLGRGLWTYENGKAKRIANWRVNKIKQDCVRLISQRPTLPLSSLPASLQRKQVGRLIDALVTRSTQLLSEKDGLDFEKRILHPVRARDEYSNRLYGFTPFDMASTALGMNRKAFDLMVAKNCEIFRSVGKFSQRWYLSDLYLNELSKKKEFNLISAKYERMAKALHRAKQDNTCMC